MVDDREVQPVMKRLDLVAGLSLARTALGVGALLAPGPTLKALTLDPARNPQLPYLSRVAGARDIALGVATLLASSRSSGTGRRFMVAAGIAVDLSDAVAAGVSFRELGRGRAAYLALPAVAAVGVGLAALVEDLRSRRA
jgi:hypothetical protein